MAPGTEDGRSHAREDLSAVALASAVGGLARYLLGGWLARAGASFPWETLAINVSGSFALGLLLTLFVEVAAAAAWLRAALLVGFLGSYTTFSTFALESFRLIEDGTMRKRSPTCSAASSPGSSPSREHMSWH